MCVNDPSHLPVFRGPSSQNPVRNAMTRDDHDKRQAIIDACRRMNALGINQGISGNISVCHGDGLHGMIAIGSSLAKAMWPAFEVETLARQYHGCLQIGQPPLLPTDEIESVRMKMVGDGLAGA
jgi:ribulose-5-phosphate 4-epimerase/fuculose-1-phosphate aldolase